MYNNKRKIFSVYIRVKDPENNEEYVIMSGEWALTSAEIRAGGLRDYLRFVVGSLRNICEVWVELNGKEIARKKYEEGEKK